MYSTKVTKLKKRNGVLVFNYDVYIGPSVLNVHLGFRAFCVVQPLQFRQGW